MFRALNDWVIVSEIPAGEQLTKGGLVLPGNVSEAQDSKEYKVVAVGPGPRLPDGSRADMGISKGDLVRVNATYTPVSAFRCQGETYYIIKEPGIVTVSSPQVKLN
jgi:chaperonin GroES